MLAIVIPYYKITFFEKVLKSLGNQTDKRFNVYIGNDASPENPEELLEKYKGKFDFVYHKFNNNLGSISLVRQWDRCIELMNDEKWLMILGDDDELSEGTVAAFYQNLDAIDRNKSNVVRFSTQIVDNIRGRVSKVFTHPKLEKASDSYYRKFSRESRSSLSEHIFRTKIYKKYKFKNYPLAWFSDDYAWLEFAEIFPIYSINEALVFINVSTESLTGNVNNLIEKNNAEIMFYNDLINHHQKDFNSFQLGKIVLQTEIALREYRKMTFTEWVKLSKIYITNFLVFSFLKLIRRFVINYF